MSPSVLLLFSRAFAQVAARVEQEGGSTVLVNACCPGEGRFHSGGKYFC